MEDDFYYCYLYGQRKQLDIGYFDVPRGWEIYSHERGQITEGLILRKLKTDLTSSDSEFMHAYSETHEVY